jgi:ubiquitin carboxyl-terminal hydrolase 5/13
MESIEALAPRCRVATPSDTVLHSECAYTFHSPYSSDNGIVVNLNSFIGTIQDLAFTNLSEAKDIFLRIVKKRVEKIVEDGKEEEKPTKLAIGVDGGFTTDDDKYETISTYAVVVLENPGRIVVELPYDEAEKEKFPESVVNSVESVINHVGLAIQQDLSAWEDNEEIPVSKYAADLPFEDNGVTISPDPKSWKCEKSGDTENIWLNLSDGFIGGGRKNWDGSGGSNGALDHFQETGETYPLVVKLGTITAEGSTVHADCYSYAKDENGPVKILNLKELLLKRGIQVAGLQKTEKSTAELEVELNAVSDLLVPHGKESVACAHKEYPSRNTPRTIPLTQSQKADPSSFRSLDQVSKGCRTWEILVT